MRALILDGKVIDVQEVEFEVHESMTWVDCDVSVKLNDSYDGTSFTSNELTQQQIDEIVSLEQSKASAAAAGNQKLLDLGLTQAEATALTGYTPPTE